MTAVELPPETVEFIERLARERAGHHMMNGYRCNACGRVVMTIDVDYGVTPMLISCQVTEGCYGRMQSFGYPNELPPASLNLGEPTLEWYRPDADEFDGLSLDMQKHILNGGLARRARTDRLAAGASS